MTEVLRPHVATCASHIVDVVHYDGGYAALSTGIELFDEALAPRGSITGTHNETKIVALAGERFLLHGERLSWLYEGKVGGSIAKVDDELVMGVAATQTGFLAFTSKFAIVDQNGARTQVAVDGCHMYGGCAWRGGAAVAGPEGLAILGADGAVIARSTEKPQRAPVALANAIAVPTGDDIALLDDSAQVVGRLPIKVDDNALTAFRDGVLVSTHDDEADESRITYWEGLEERWSGTFDELVGFVIAGDRIVVTSYEKNAWILDGSSGKELAKLETAKPVDGVDAFGDGVALAVRDSHEVLWWRPDTEIARLEHDVKADGLHSVPAGLVSTEAKYFYLWRTDEQGPELPRVESSLPMGSPLVIGGSIVKIVGAGRFALRGQALNGRARLIERDATYRPMVTRDEATRIVERLVSRTFDGPLPAIPTDQMVHEVDAKLSQLPLSETVDLHGRALFASSTLEPEVKKRSGWARVSFFEELGAALGMSGRMVLAAVKSRKLKLEPPRAVPGYEYLGTFTTSGALTVSDPCNINRKVNTATGLALSLKVAGHEGVWHVFVRGGAGIDRDRTGELVTIHDEGFDVWATDYLGTIGVDSGSVGVFDKKCPKRDEDAPFEEGTFAALGALASSGYGDGTYPVFVGKAKGRVAKIRVHFIGDGPEADRTMAKSKAAAKPYSATAKFDAGDTIEHVKFGQGSVVRVGGDGKIDVRFADGVRTLVHGKK